MISRRTRFAVMATAAAAIVLLVPGAASACQVPATAEVACAPDLHHWEGTITVSNAGPSTFIVTSASLDTTSWASEARLTGLVPGATIATGATLTARATGLPLSTSGATIDYAGRWADGRVESASISLGRPAPSCEEVTTTTEATTTTTTEAPTSVATSAPTTSVPPSSIPGTVVSTTPTSQPSEVLGETETSSPVPTLARTGPGSVGQLAFGAILLLIVGVGLVALAMAGSSERPHHRPHR